MFDDVDSQLDNAGAASPEDLAKFAKTAMETAEMLAPYAETPFPTVARIRQAAERAFGKVPVRVSPLQVDQPAPQEQEG